MGTMYYISSHNYLGCGFYLWYVYTHPEAPFHAKEQAWCPLCAHASIRPQKHLAIKICL